MLLHVRLSFGVAAALIVSAAVMLTACGPATYAPTPFPTAPTVATSSVPAPSALPLSASPTLAPQASPSPLLLKSPSHTPRLVVLAQDLGMPDDLVLAPDHSIYFSDVGDGTVKRLDGDGNISRIVSRLQEPEGLVFLPDGSLVIAEQGRNRLLRFDLNTKRLTTFLELVNNTGQPGLDGIAYDSRTMTLIIPDSPNGTVLRIGQDGKNVQVIARGFARPTGAGIEPDGSILVADENGNAISRLTANSGSAVVLARLPLPDDLLVDENGNIYVNSLGEGTIHLMDATTGENQIYWRGLSEPQGMIFDAEGNLIIADPGNHRLVKLIIQ